jgi:N-methylhydantoinase A
LIGTDVGGTFTDLVFVTSSGEAHCFKVPSTPSRPGESIRTGVEEIRAMLHPDAMAWRDAFHTHSSTVATNALIERRGARIGMIATTGFRDLFELQRLALPHPMRFDSRRPAPLVPRELVRTGRKSIRWMTPACWWRRENWRRRAWRSRSSPSCTAIATRHTNAALAS